MDDTVTCLVRGPGSRYPRGFIWLIPAWFAIVTAAVVLAGDQASGKIPLWLGCCEVGGLAIAFVTLASVLGTVRRRAFRADKHGIWLGVPTGRKRPKLRQVHLAWPEVAQLRLVPRSYGVLLEITLGPSARIVHRRSLPRQALLLLGSLVMPVGFGRGAPALTAARPGPRYLVKICDYDTVQLRAALALVKPDEVQLRTLTRKGALRLTAPPPRTQAWPPAGPQPRKAFGRRPASPVGK
jgi:hypothetical protein